MQTVRKEQLELYVNNLSEDMQIELDIDWTMGQPKVWTKTGREITTRGTKKEVYYQVRSAIQVIRAMKDVRGQNNVK